MHNIFIQVSTAASVRVRPAKSSAVYQMLFTQTKNPTVATKQTSIQSFFSKGQTVGKSSFWLMAGKNPFFFHRHLSN